MRLRTCREARCRVKPSVSASACSEWHAALACVTTTGASIQPWRVYLFRATGLSGSWPCPHDDIGHAHVILLGVVSDCVRRHTLCSAVSPPPARAWHMQCMMLASTVPVVPPSSWIASLQSVTSDLALQLQPQADTVNDSRRVISSY